MKATDLMIGDWVFHIRNRITQDIQTGHPVRVLGVLEHGIQTDDGFIRNEDISPFLLTPEILEKNGFERGVSSIVRTSTCAMPICESDTFCCCHDGHTLKDINIKDRGIWGWSVRSRVVCDTNWNEIHEIRFVHELQHALRLCGIEKEIEL